MSRDFKADLAILTSGQWGRHEEDWFKNNGVEIAVSAIERADKYEALAREQENQIDILSTTLAMYCSPYYDMQERAMRAEKALVSIKLNLRMIEHLTQGNRCIELTRAVKHAYLKIEEALGDEQRAVEGNS